MGQPELNAIALFWAVSYVKVFRKLCLKLGGSGEEVLPSQHATPPVKAIILIEIIYFILPAHCVVVGQAKLVLGIQHVP